MPKKGNTVNSIRILDLIPGGEARGVALAEDATEFHIHFDARTVAPGDLVSARLLGKHDRRWQGRVESMQEPSKVRRDPMCQHFGVCGGCGLQHIAYSEQLRLKEGLVQACLGNQIDPALWLPIIACPPEAQFHFRNKMEFTASARAYQLDPDSTPQAGPGAIGLFVPFCGNKVLDVQNCHLQPEIGNTIRNWLRQFAERKGLSYYHSSRHEGFIRTLLIRTNLQGDALVMLIVAEENAALAQSICQELAAEIPQAKSIWYLINTKLNDSYADLDPIHVCGAPHIVETLGNLHFHVRPQTFLQVNSRQTTVLYNRILELAELSGAETVYDLYCGVGTIAAWIAKRVKSVVGIEFIEASVSAAHQACLENGIHNCRFFAGDIKDLLVPNFFKEQGQPDLIITDPPRAGMHPKVCQALTDAGARRIVYVSCNPTSLARDLTILTTRYRILSAQAIDLMPQSHHIETLVALELI